MGRTTLAATGMAAILTAGAALPAHAHTTPAQPDTVVAAQADTTANNTRTWAEESSAWAEAARWITNDLSSGAPNIVGSLASVVGMFGLLLIVLDNFAQLDRWNNKGA